MSDIFDRVAEKQGDIFDRVAPAAQGDVFDRVAQEEEPGIVGRALSRAGQKLGDLGDKVGAAGEAFGEWFGDSPIAPTTAIPTRHPETGETFPPEMYTLQRMYEAPAKMREDIPRIQMERAAGYEARPDEFVPGGFDLGEFEHLYAQHTEAKKKDPTARFEAPREKSVFKTGEAAQPRRMAEMLGGFITFPLQLAESFGNQIVEAFGEDVEGATTLEFLTNSIGGTLYRDIRRGRETGDWSFPEVRYRSEVDPEGIIFELAIAKGIGKGAKKLTDPITKPVKQKVTGTVRKSLDLAKMDRERVKFSKPLKDLNRAVKEGKITEAEASEKLAAHLRSANIPLDVWELALKDYDNLLRIEQEVAGSLPKEAGKLPTALPEARIQDIPVGEHVGVPNWMRIIPVQENIPQRALPRATQDFTRIIPVGPEGNIPQTALPEARGAFTRVIPVGPEGAIPQRALPIPKGTGEGFTHQPAPPAGVRRPGTEEIRRQLMYEGKITSGVEEGPPVQPVAPRERPEVFRREDGKVVPERPPEPPATPPTEAARPPVEKAKAPTLDEIRAATDRQIKRHEREQAAEGPREPTVEFSEGKPTVDEVLSQKGKPEPRVTERRGDTRIPEIFESPEDAIDFGTRLGRGEIAGISPENGLKALGRRLREKNKRLNELFDKKEKTPSQDLTDLSYQIPRFKEAIDAAVKERRLADKKKPDRIDKERTLDSAAKAQVDEGLEPARVENLAKTLPQEAREGARREGARGVEEEAQLPKGSTEEIVPTREVQEAVNPAKEAPPAEKKAAVPEEPALPTKKVQNSIDRALTASEIIRTTPKKKALESALASLRLHAEKLGLDVDTNAGTYFSVEKYREIAGNVDVAIGQKYGSHPTEALRAKRDAAGPSPKVVAGTHKQIYRPAETRAIEQELIQKFLEKKQEQGKPAVASAPYIWAESGKYTVEGGKLKKEHPLSKDAIGRILENNYDETGKYGSYNRAAKELIEKERAEREVAQEKKHAAEQAKRAEEAKEAAEKNAIKEEIDKKYGKRKFKKQTITVKGNDGPLELSGYAYKGLLAHKEPRGYKPKYVVTHIKSGKRISNPMTLPEARTFAARFADSFDTTLPEKPFIKQPGVMEFGSALRKNLYAKLRETKGEVKIPAKTRLEKIDKRIEKQKFSKDFGDKMADILRGKEVKEFTSALEAGEVPEVSRAHLQRMGHTPKTIDAIESLKEDVRAGKEVDVAARAKAIYEAELTEAIQQSALDKQATEFLKSADIQDYLDLQPDIGKELTLAEIRKASAEIKDLRKSGYYVPIEFWDQFILDPKKGDVVVRGGKEWNVDKVGEEWTSLIDPKDPTAKKKSVPTKGLRQMKMGDIGPLTELADITRLMQELDGGKVDGWAQRSILWPARRNTVGSFLFADMEKVSIAKSIDKHKIKRRKLDKLATDVLEHIPQDAANVPIEQLLEKQEIAAKIGHLPKDVQKRIAGYAQDHRRFFDRWIDLQNQARSKRGQEEIPYRDNYAPWIAEANAFRNAYGWLLKKQDIMQGPQMADFIQPNKPFNPRELKRYGGDYTKERRLSRLAASYVDTALKDIFHTNTIHNNKIHAKVLREAGYVNAASALEKWTSEVFAGVPHRITKTAKELVPKPLREGPIGYLSIRRRLTAAVFPLNWTWNAWVQTSSVGLTYARYGGTNFMYGLKYLVDPQWRNYVQKNAYSMNVKRRWGGSAHYQDVGESLTKAKKIEASGLDTVTNYMSFVTQVVEDALTGHAVTAAWRDGKKKGMSGRALWEYASDGGSKTQSMYNAMDQPGILRSRDLTAFIPFQTFAFEVMNTVREIAPTGKYKTGAYSMTLQKRAFALARWAAAIYVTNAVVDRAIGRKPWDFSSFVPFSGTLLPTYGASPFSAKATVPVQYGMQFQQGMRDYLKYGDWGKLRKWTLRYHMKGGVQFDRMIRGIEAASEGKVKNVAGRKMYKVGYDEKWKAVLMGPERTEEGKEYYRRMRESQSVIPKD